MFLIGIWTVFAAVMLLFVTSTLVCFVKEGLHFNSIQFNTELKPLSDENNCLINLCQNGGECIDGLNNFDCECQELFCKLCFQTQTIKLLSN